MIKKTFSVKLGKSLGLLFVALLLSSLTPTFMGSSSSTTRIYLHPSNYIFSKYTATIGTRFNVTVMVEGVPSPGMVSYQIAINYNDTIINATRWFEPHWNSSYVFFNRTTLPTALAYAHTPPDHGQVLTGSILHPLPSQTPFIGSGLVCIVEFVIKAVPPVQGVHNCTLHINKPGTYILDPGGEEISPVDKQDGYYEITGASAQINSVEISSILKVDANITCRGVDNITEIMDFVMLSFKIENQWYMMDMTYNTETDLYSALIPAYNQLADKTIQYSITARDKEGQFIGSDVYIYHVPEWVVADYNRDGIVDMKDIYIAVRHYGETDT